MVRKILICLSTIVALAATAPVAMAQSRADKPFAAVIAEFDLETAHKQGDAFHKVLPLRKLIDFLKLNFLMIKNHRGKRYISEDPNKWNVTAAVVKIKRTI